MKRKNASRYRIGYHQLEDRRLLAAIANGQEIVSSIPIGGTETFEFEVNAVGIVRVAVSETIQQDAQAELQILDSNGASVPFESSDNAFHRQSPFVKFSADETGSYSFVVSDVGNDDAMEFAIRGLALPDSASLIAGRDKALQNGEEFAFSLPSGSFAAFPIEATVPGTILVSVGTASDEPIFGFPTIQLVDANGNEVASSSNFLFGSDALSFQADQPGTYTAIVGIDGEDGAADSSFRIRSVTLPVTPTLIGGRDAILQTDVEQITSIPNGSTAVFPFEVASAGLIVITADAVEAGSTAPLIQLFDVAGSEVASNRSSGSGVLDFAAVEAGTFHAVVTNRPAVGEPREFRVRAVFPNNNQPAGVSLNNGEEQEFTIDDDSAAIFTIQANLGDNVIVSTGEVAFNDSRPSLRIFDRNGTPVASDEGTSTAIVNFQAPQDGVYTAIVQHTSAFTAGLVDFRIRTAIVTGSPTMIPGRDLALDNGVEVVSTVPRGSLNVFTFDVNLGGNTLLSLSSADNQFPNVLVRVFDAAGLLVLSTRGLQGVIEFATEQSSTYTVVLSHEGIAALDSTFLIRRVTFSDTPALVNDREHELVSGQEVITEPPRRGFAVFPIQVNSGDFVRIGAAVANVASDSPLENAYDSSGIPVTNDLGDNQGLFEFTAGLTETIYIVVSNNAGHPLRLRTLILPGSVVANAARDSVLTTGDQVNSSVPRNGLTLFPIEVVEAGPVLLQIDNISSLSTSTPNFRLEVFRTDGTLVDAFDGTTELLAFEAELPGAYLVVVSGQSRFVTFNFSISMTIVSSSFSIANGEERLLPLGPGERLAVPIELLAGQSAILSYETSEPVYPGTTLRILTPSGALQPETSLLSAAESGVYYAIITADPDWEETLEIRYRVLILPGDPMPIVGRDQHLSNGVEVEVSSPSNSLSFFTFDVVTPGEVYFTAIPVPYAGSLFIGAPITIWDASGQAVPLGTDLTTNGVQTAAVTPGRYTAVVGSRGFTPESSLRVRVVSINDSFETIPGRDQTLAIGEEALTALPRDTYGLFPITVETPGRIWINAGATQGVPELTILGPDGTTVAKSNQTGFLGSERPSVLVSFDAIEAGEYVAVVYDKSRRFTPSSMNVRIRAVGSPDVTALVEGRDLVVDEQEIQSTVIPAASVAYLPIEVASAGEVKLFAFSQASLLLLSPAGDSVDFEHLIDNRLTFTASTPGTYALIASNKSSSGEATVTIGGLPAEQPIQNGQEVSSILIPHGIAILPLDFETGFFGQLNITGSAGESSVTPLVRLYDLDGNLRESNQSNSSFRDRDNVLWRAFRSPGRLIAVVSNTEDTAIDFTVRAASFSGPVSLVNGRDTALQNGVTHSGVLPQDLFALFPVEVVSPGLVRVELDVSLADSAADLSRVRIFDADGGLVIWRNGGSELVLEYEATQTGTYHIWFETDERFSFSTPAVEDPKPFDITVTGISQARPEVTSFEREQRNAKFTEVLAQPDKTDALTLRFNQDVSLQLSDLVVRNDTTGGNVVDTTGSTLTYDPATMTATWDLSGLNTALPAGFYSASLVAGGITSVSSGQAMAADFSSRFHVALPGDSNLDGVVDVLGDAARLVSNLNRTGPLVWADSDFNSDGSVDILSDAAVLVNNLGRSITPTEARGFERDGRETSQLTALGRPDLAETLTVDFSVNVDVSASDWVLRNETTDSLIDVPEEAFSYDAGTRRATLSLPALANPLSPGYYSIDILASSVNNATTQQSLLQDVHDEFYIALPGDTNYDGSVDVLTDAATLIQNLGRTEFATWQRGDFNDDGQVDVLGDAAVLTDSLGQSVLRDQAFATLTD